ncbi:MAG: type II toxin-antitoxin system VapC family toxin [Bacillota bacterium]|nr:type II toxin-antitoxin system VapC family toxin [Bacillota bacterium]
MSEKQVVIYWDSTALLSYLFKDSHSEEIMERARARGVHLLTTLAAAEVYTVISRIHRERVLPDVMIDSLFELLEKGPWSRLNIVPDRSALKELARRWPLKGSGLWHLATALTLQREFPELMVLTLNEDLARASRGEKLKLCLTLNGRQIKKRKSKNSREKNGRDGIT